MADNETNDELSKLVLRLTRSWNVYFDALCRAPINNNVIFWKPYRYGQGRLHYRPSDD